MDYRPVCGRTGDEVETFANGCTACSDKRVKGFYLGACPEAPAEEPAEEEETAEEDSEASEE